MWALRGVVAEGTQLLEPPPEEEEDDDDVTTTMSGLTSQRDDGLRSIPSRAIDNWTGLTYSPTISSTARSSPSTTGRTKKH